MATKTAAQALSGVQPRGNHTSIDAVRCVVSLTSSASAGDVYVLGKVPNGSTLIGVVGAGTAGGGPGAGNDFLVTFDLNGVTLGSATALSSGFLNLPGCPETLSLSDDATPQYAYLKATAGTITSATATGSLSLTMLLTRDA